MQPPARRDVEGALAEIIREALTRREAVYVPGLGTFEVRHRSSILERAEENQLRVTPPRDEVTFTAEETDS